MVGDCGSNRIRYRSANTGRRRSRRFSMGRRTHLGSTDHGCCSRRDRYLPAPRESVKEISPFGGAFAAFTGQARITRQAVPHAD